MKRLLILLLLAVGLVIPTSALFTAPASAVTCSGIIQRDGNEAEFGYDVGAPGGALKHGWHHGRVFFKNCYQADGDRFVKIIGYNVILRQDNDPCANVDEWWYDPNAIHWWNPEPSKSINCEESSTGVVSWSPSTPVNVFRYLPANERCIGAEAKAGIAPGPDAQVKDVPTMCFLD